MNVSDIYNSWCYELVLYILDLDIDLEVRLDY